MFLQHEGFLGALGAFTAYKKHDHEHDQLVQRCSSKLSCEDSKLCGGTIKSS